MAELAVVFVGLDSEEHAGEGERIDQELAGLVELPQSHRFVGDDDKIA